MLAADHSRIEVGHGHGRRSDGGLAVDLGMVALVHRRIVAA
jgi:hypothetical protein